jgi:hypothetical protein
VGVGWELGCCEGSGFRRSHKWGRWGGTGSERAVGRRAWLGQSRGARGSGAESAGQWECRRPCAGVEGAASKARSTREREKDKSMCAHSVRLRVRQPGSKSTGRKASWLSC